MGLDGAQDGAPRKGKKKRPRPSTERPAASPHQPRPREAPPSVFAAGALDVAPALRPFPYPHQWLPGLFDRSALLAVREELGSLQRTFKETDLFKVYQTGDLANVDPSDPVHAAQLPHTIRLRSALYSPAFRAWVSNLTGCAELTEQQDCSCNVYGRGGHLLCHDDVIGTRAVSYILYLSWPDEEWTASLGGALELYELDPPPPKTKIAGGPRPPPAARPAPPTPPPAQPRASPSLLLPPAFGSLALFPVAPGRSFHAVAEVLSPAEPRVSISGWFHAPAPPAGAEASASLAQLQAAAGAAQVEFGSLPAPQKPKAAPTSHGTEPKALTADSAPDPAAAPSPTPFTPSLAVPRSLPAAAASSLLSHLSGLISPSYLRPDTLKAVRAQLRSQGVVQLSAFLRPEIAASLLDAAAAADRHDGLGEGKTPEYRAGVGGGWEVVGPPHLQRYLRYIPPGGAGWGAAAGPSAAASGQAEAGVGEVPLRPTEVQGATDVLGAGVGPGSAASPPNAASVAGELLRGVASILLSPPFLWLLERISGGTPTHGRTQIRRFRPGIDYTLAHAAQMITAKELRRRPHLDATFVVSPASRPGARPARRAAAAWDGGDVGGFDCLVPADDSPAAAEVYRADDTSQGVTCVHAVSNSLVLALRPARTMRFVKYVSAAAPGSRWDVSVEYQLAPAAGGEGEGREGGGGGRRAGKVVGGEGRRGGRDGSRGGESARAVGRGGKRGGAEGPAQAAGASASVPKRDKSPASSGHRHKSA